MENLVKETGDLTAYRLVIFGDGSVRTIPLEGDRWTIGRSPDCEITLRDPTVSRRHLLLERTGNGIRMKELGGRNPVLVDGTAKTEALLQAGSRLSIGLTRIELEARQDPQPISPSTETVVITGREVIDDELPVVTNDSDAIRAQRILERIEWTFADLGSLSDAADPLLTLAMNLTSYRRGMLARLHAQGDIEPLARHDATTPRHRNSVPESVLKEARRLRHATLLTGRSDSGRHSDMLLIPLGERPDGIILLEAPAPDAPTGQSLLRLAKSIGAVTWHRIVEVMERLRMRDEIERLSFQGSAAHHAVLTSTRLQGARQHLRTLANASSPVLLVGEEGTEREDLARYLHAEGCRRGKAFVSVHLGLVPEWRIEKELFGSADCAGGAAFRARGGTLFLDEVELLPRHLQQRLCEILQPDPEGKVEGPRLVAAAPEPPDPESDAWFPRLADGLRAHTVTIPPLRDEPADVLALAELILSDMGADPDGAPRLLSERAKRALRTYNWPRNVKQLRLVLEDAAARAGTHQIAPRHLPAEITMDAKERASTTLPSLADVERRHIRDTLRRLGGNRARTAQVLGIANSTLYEKLRRYGIEG